MGRELYVDHDLAGCQGELFASHEVELGAEVEGFLVDDDGVVERDRGVNLNVACEVFDAFVVVGEQGGVMVDPVVVGISGGSVCWHAGQAG